MTIQHTITIEPPNEQRLHWLVVCSHGDLSRSYRNRAEAYMAANGHIGEVILRAELEQGRYHFNDGEDVRIRVQNNEPI